MKLRPFEIMGHGDLQAEYVGIIANASCLASNYYLVTCQMYGNKIRFQRPSVYQLPSLRLEAGDEVKVWTKARALTVHTLSSGRRLNEVGWGRRRPIWNAEFDGVVLQEVRAYTAIF